MLLDIAARHCGLAFHSQKVIKTSLPSKILFPNMPTQPDFPSRHPHIPALLSALFAHLPACFGLLTLRQAFQQAIRGASQRFRHGSQRHCRGQDRLDRRVHRIGEVR